MELSEEFERTLRMITNPKAFPRYAYGHNLCKRDEDFNGRIVDRVQVQFDESRFGFILRHTTRYHWCAYILIPEVAWLKHATDFHIALDVELNLAVQAYSPICWMGMNSDSELKSPLSITSSDFWIGFDLAYTERPAALNTEYALAELIRIEDRIYRIRNGHLAP